MSGKLKIAILDDYQNIAQKVSDWSKIKAHADVDVFDHHLSIEEAKTVLKPYDILCHLRERMAMPRELFDALPNLKMCAIVGVEHRTLDKKAASERGILVCNDMKPGGGGHGTPELAWGLLIAAARGIAIEHEGMRKGGWQGPTMGVGMAGKTLGLLGLGRLGKRMVEYAKAFGMPVIAWSQNLTDEAAAAVGAKRVDKADLFKQSDFVSIHYVLSDRSRGIVGPAEFAVMKPMAYIVNTSRGPIIQQQALIDALKSKKIAGAAVDVYDVEPLPENSPLRTVDNLTMTPHLGYVTRESLKLFYDAIVRVVEAYVDGKPIGITNPEAVKS
jgi:phosphoglycerate dehydrogenase-like enzyme